MRFTIYRVLHANGRLGPWRGRLASANGEPRLHSESFTRKIDAVRWAKDLKRDAAKVADAEIVVDDKEPVARQRVTRKKSR